MHRNASPPSASAPSGFWNVPGSGSGQRRGRVAAGVASVAAHLMVFAVLLWPRAAVVAVRPDPVPSLVMVDVPAPPVPPGPPAPARTEASAQQSAQVPKPPRPDAPLEVAASAPVADTSDLLSEAQIAGAAVAGAGGGGCDTALLVQRALRRDPLVRAAVADANRQGKAILVWNGDWVRSGAQDGKGLSAVREAITWEVAFAPEACRNQRVHGLVVLSLGDGGTRFAIGADDWQWSALLGVGAGRAHRR